MTMVTPNDPLLERLAHQEEELTRLREELRLWRQKVASLRGRTDVDFTTISGRELEPVYTALDVGWVRAVAG